MKQANRSKKATGIPSGIHARLMALVFIAALAGPALAEPIVVTDLCGRELVLRQRPAKVISLAPAVTEMIFALGAGEAVTAVTSQDSLPHGAAGLPVVDGSLNPSLEMIMKLAPEVIFLSPKHPHALERLTAEKTQVIQLDVNSLADVLAAIQLLGKIFQKEEQAERIVAGIQAELELIRGKIARIPTDKRRRVLRIMAGETLMTPGDDSVQNEFIRAAGGLTPSLGKQGPYVPIALAEWRKFNPQVIYGCDDEREAVQRLLDQEGWQEVAAVKNHCIFYFPCGLTCHAGVQSGYFVSWLSARIYKEFYSDRSRLVKAEGVVSRRPLLLELPYLKSAGILDNYLYDFLNKSLVIDFQRPQTILSTLDGWREGIQTIGNHYLPPQTWGLGHENDLPALKARVAGVLGKPVETASFLFTGADMDHLAVEQRTYRDMTVWALVTAGVQSNALRTARDPGRYYEPGTINILLLTNTKLSPSAMTRAIITATEAKTAALQDLDIRSSETPLFNAATGTGTDNIILVQGEGPPIENTGGHTKMGELMAAAVHAGVTRAIQLQNRLTAGRHILRRLQERGISLFQLISKNGCKAGEDPDGLTGAVAAVLLDSRYAGFMAASLALSDSHEQGLTADLSTHETWCRSIAAEIAGAPIERFAERVEMQKLPVVLRMSLNAVLNGVYQRQARR